MAESKRILLVAFLAAASRCLAADSLHEARAGTEVEGTFVLAGKIVPLPPGKFKLVLGRLQPVQEQSYGSRQAFASGIAEVILVQTEGAVFRALVQARANAIVSGTRWTDEPCKRTDTLFALDRAQYGTGQDCVMLNHAVGWLKAPGGVWVGVRDALAAQGVELPVATLLRAEVTRIDNYQYLKISYEFNPEAFGYAADPRSWSASSWHRSRVAADPGKAAFVAALTGWAMRLQPVVDSGFEGKAFAPEMVPALRLPVR